MTAGDHGLPADLRCLIELSAALAAGDEAVLERELRRAAAGAVSGLESIHVDEAIMQSCLFVGFPAALEAAAAWRELIGEPAADDDPLAAPGRAVEREARGEAYCRMVYGSAYEALRRNVAGVHPALDHWMVAAGYGTVLGRPGLEPAPRELCIVAVLAAQARDRQLYSHLRGALHSGASTDWTAEALEIGLSRAAENDRARLLELWAEIRRRNATGERNPDVR